MTNDDELEAIRKRKTEELIRLAEIRKERMEELKNAEEAPQSVEEKDKIALMQFFLVPEAYDYWSELYNSPNKNQTAEIIFKNVLYMIKIGFLEGKQISRLGIKKLEREIEGIPSSITIKRKGEKKKTVNSLDSS
jgi:DNA-binding TFAR19-related protein (PDSD5 family)